MEENAEWNGVGGFADASAGVCVYVCVCGCSSTEVVDCLQGPVAWRR